MGGGGGEGGWGRGGVVQSVDNLFKSDTCYSLNISFTFIVK